MADESLTTGPGGADQSGVTDEATREDARAGYAAAIDLTGIALA
jgi:hypothetical protein